MAAWSASSLLSKARKRVHDDDANAEADELSLVSPKKQKLNDSPPASLKKTSHDINIPPSIKTSINVAHNPNSLPSQAATSNPLLGSASSSPAKPPSLSQPNITQSPFKARPAIKLAALRGTIWDAGDSPPKAKASSAVKKTSSDPRKNATPTGGTPTKPGRPKSSKKKAEDEEKKKTRTPTKARSGSPKRSRASSDAYDVDEEGDNDDADDDDDATAKQTSSFTNRLAKTKADGASPGPKGILTPSKNRGGRLPKSVSFGGGGGGEKTSREIFFEDLKKTKTPAKKPRAPRKPKKEADDEIRCEICSKGHSKPPNEIILCDNCDFAVHQDCYDVSEIPEGDWLCKSCDQEDVVKGLGTVEDVVEVKSTTTVAGKDVPDIANLDHHLRVHQRILLDRCAGRRRIKLFGQQEVYEKARQLVEQTVVSGEGNSLLLIGARGSGKTTLVENVITDLSKEHRHEFHVVRLNGFIHTDDKLALKDIWRQLGKEMEVADDYTNRTNYADTMTSLLALLSHPSEIMATDQDVTSQSVVFVIDEFDMFASHSRQTLLYNLFDIAQSRKAPIAVLGCTTRLNVVEMLEKRVKSRFSHRYVYLSLPRSLPAYWQICRQGLIVDPSDAKREGIDPSMPGYDDFRRYWTHKIEEMYKQRAFQELLQFHYYTTKSASAFFAEWMLPLSSLSLHNLTLDCPTTSQGGGGETTSLIPPDSRMQLLQSLSELDLGLLIAAARLDIIVHTDTVNFAMAYDEYSSLVGKQRVQSATSGMLVMGGGIRVWSRGVAGTAWERLVTLGLLLPTSGYGAAAATAAGRAGLGGHGHGGLDGKMWKLDVALEEIPTAVKLNNVLSKWCREI